MVRTIPLAVPSVLIGISRSAAISGPNSPTSQRDKSDQGIYKVNLLFMMLDSSIRFLGGGDLWDGNSPPSLPRPGFFVSAIDFPNACVSSHLAFKVVDSAKRNIPVAPVALAA